jgi:beta-phosphoglucomutase-like phosphatase (HAD superfamily)
MRFDLVIFDCDGVLIDSELLALRAAVACLAEYGVAISDDEILERYTGISTAGMVADQSLRR